MMPPISIDHESLKHQIKQERFLLDQLKAKKRDLIKSLAIVNKDISEAIQDYGSRFAPC